jgi:hypothetical protein
VGSKVRLRRFLYGVALLGILLGCLQVAPAADAQGPDFPSCGEGALGVGQVVESPWLTNMQFITPTHGVAITLGDLTCGPDLGGPYGSQTLNMRFATTSNGGQTWIVKSILTGYATNSPNIYTPAAPPVTPLVFVGPTHGWVLAQNHLLATQDGGATWHSVHPDGTVLALAGDGLRAAMVVTTCRAPYPLRCQRGAVLRLFTFSEASNRWVGTSPVPISSKIVPSVDQLLVGPAIGQAYISTFDPPDTSSRLFETADGGVHWIDRKHPCSNDPPFPYEGIVGSAPTFEIMAQSPSGELWMVCHGQPAASNVPAAVFVSRNGGQSWSRRYAGAATDVGPGLAVLSNQDALWTQGYSLAMTTDGGATWSPNASVVSGGGPDVFSVLSPTNVWVLQVLNAPNRPVLWHSTSGVTFSPVS